MYIEAKINITIKFVLTDNIIGNNVKCKVKR